VTEIERRTRAWAMWRKAYIAGRTNNLGPSDEGVHEHRNWRWASTFGRHRRSRTYGWPGAAP
jgi:hypothetical protein